MKNKNSRVEKILMALIAALWLIPLPLTAFFHFHKGRLPTWTNWLASRTLTGMQVQQEYPKASWKSIISAKYQAGLADQFNDTFGGRELLIRLNNELCFRLLKTSALTTTFELEHNAGIVVGKEGQLFEYLYLQEYCLVRPEVKELRKTVAQLKQFQDGCSRLGIPMVLVITPSKVAVYSDDIPDRWMKRCDPRPRGYDLMVPMLKQSGIHFVDGHALIMAAKGKTQYPPFPIAGIHWTEDASLPVANAMIDELRSQGLKIKNIDASNLERDDDSFAMEHDLEKIVNIATGWHYPVLRLKPNALEKNPALNAVSVGGSFTWNLVGALAGTNQFSEIDCFYYYRLAKYCYIFGESWELEKIGDRPIDFDREVYAADCIILEVNEEQIPGSNSVSRFLPDAVADIPKDGIRKPFLSEKYRDYHWGDDISFASSDPHAVRVSNLSGFAGLEPAFTWTDKSDAEVRLVVPPAEKDVLLEAKVGALLKPRQTQKADIYINDELVGSWTFAAPQPSRHEVLIPAKLIGGGGKLTIRFHLDHIARASEVVGNTDDRMLGISFSKMRLRYPGEGADLQ